MLVLQDYLQKLSTQQFQLQIFVDEVAWFF